MEPYGSIQENVRDDFRCAICRRKRAFQCEHNTPYRDEFLGIDDSISQEESSPITACRRSIAEITVETATSSSKSKRQNKTRLNNPNQDQSIYDEKVSKDQQQTSTTMKNTDVKSRTCIIV